MATSHSFGDFELAGWEDEETAAEYDRHLSLVTTQSIEALLDDAGVARGDKVLDVATGVGYVVAAAAQRGAEPVGIDFSATQVRLARERYPTARFEQADAQALPSSQRRLTPSSTRSASAICPILISACAKRFACSSGAVGLHSLSGIYPSAS